MENSINLWENYRQCSDLSSREKLILHYMPLVKYVASRLAFALPPSLHQEDLTSYGILGLIEAIDRFDPTRGVKFETYAAIRIKGKIRDALRALDVLPRSVYRQMRQIKQASANLSQSLGRMPTDQEVARQLGICLRQYQRWLQDVSFVIISLDHALTNQNGERCSLYDSLEDTSIPAPAEQIDDQMLKAELAEAVKTLPKRERLLVSLYYHKGLTMKEIATVLDVSESRVSQMHATAVRTLRGRITKRNEPNTRAYSYHKLKPYDPVYAA